MPMSDNLNSKRFGIMDAQGNHVAAGAGFLYRGFLISMTQIYSSPSVVVFNNNDPSEVVYDALSVEDAISWCDDDMNRLMALGHL